MSTGTIKRLVRDRGFGFIRDDGGQEWFFHRSSVEGSFESLNEGQRVTFDEEPSAKGPRAGHVADPAEQALDERLSLDPLGHRLGRDQKEAAGGDREQHGDEGVGRRQVDDCDRDAPECRPDDPPGLAEAARE